MGKINNYEMSKEVLHQLTINYYSDITSEIDSLDENIAKDVLKILLADYVEDKGFTYKR